MMPEPEKQTAEGSRAFATTSIRILDDGRIMTRNLTPEIAEVLLALCPDDLELRVRAGAAATAAGTGPATETPDSLSQ